jgi:hypothetical protein
MVAIITMEQKNLLLGQQYAADSYFNPIQDLNDNWIISKEEIEQNINEKFSWLTNLELIEYKPKEVKIL